MEIFAENYGERYIVQPEKHWDKHPLLEAAIEYMRIPADVAFEASFALAPLEVATDFTIVGIVDEMNVRRDKSHPPC